MPTWRGRHPPRMPRPARRRPTCHCGAEAGGLRVGGRDWSVSGPRRRAWWFLRLSWRSRGHGATGPSVRCKRRVGIARFERFASRRSLIGDRCRDTQASFRGYLKALELPNDPRAAGAGGRRSKSGGDTQPAKRDRSTASVRSDRLRRRKELLQLLPLSELPPAGAERAMG